MTLPFAEPIEILRHDRDDERKHGGVIRKAHPCEHIRNQIDRGHEVDEPRYDEDDVALCDVTVPASRVRANQPNQCLDVIQNRLQTARLRAFSFLRGFANELGEVIRCVDQSARS